MLLTAPLSDDEVYTVKSCRDKSYQNTVKLEASEQYFSTPPIEPDQGQKTLKEGLKKRLHIVKKGILGEPRERFDFD